MPIAKAMPPSCASAPEGATEPSASHLTAIRPVGYGFGDCSGRILRRAGLISEGPRAAGRGNNTATTAQPLQPPAGASTRCTPGFASGRRSDGGDPRSFPSKYVAMPNAPVSPPTYRICGAAMGVLQGDRRSAAALEQVSSCSMDV